MKWTIYAVVFVTMMVLSCGTPSPPTPAVFDTSGAEAMLEVVGAIHDGEDPARVEALFDRAMNLPSYRICVRHFTDPARPASNQVTAAQYKTFVMSLLKGPADTQNNRRLGYMAPLYRDAVRNPDKYGHAVDQCKEIPESAVSDAFDLARQWLPRGIPLAGRVQLVLDMGGGAWIFTDEHNTHHVSFNVLAMLDKEGGIDKDLFLGTLAHEMHHIGLPEDTYFKSIAYDSLPKDSRLKIYSDFVSTFISEGLAQKFCSNAPGVWTGKPAPDKPFAAIEQGRQDWTLYMSQLAEIHLRFVKDLEWILNGDVSNREAFDKNYADYWTWHAGGKEGRQSVLGRRYYYGTELMGIINRGLGKDALFELMTDYRKLPDLFNRALVRVKPAGYESLALPRELVRGVSAL